MLEKYSKMPTRSPQSPKGVANTLTIGMYYGAKPEVFALAKKLRLKQTKTESLLWYKLRNKQMAKYKFRRQHPLSIWIADFYCHKIRYVIELDGEYHLNKTQKNLDNERDKCMRELGVFVRRFNDIDILSSYEEVALQIVKDCDTLENNHLL